MTPTISVVTPTYSREYFLRQCYKCFSSQTIHQTTEVEWIILDDSPTRSLFFSQLTDPRVKYHYIPEKISGGEKRNMLAELAQGDILVNFDDDDVYADQSIETMVENMRAVDADLIKLSAWFLYYISHRIWAYIDLSKIINPAFEFCADGNIRVIDMRTTGFTNNLWGYGFNYVYKKSLLQQSLYSHKNFGVDFDFVKPLMDMPGVKLHHYADIIGLTAHIIHGRNVSKAFPQYRIPEAFIPKSLKEHPAYMEYVKNS